MADYAILKLKPNKTGRNKGRHRWKVQWRKNGKQGSKIFYSREEAKFYRDDQQSGHIETGHQTVRELAEHYLTKKYPGRVADSTASACSL